MLPKEDNLQNYALPPDSPLDMIIGTNLAELQHEILTTMAPIPGMRAYKTTLAPKPFILGTPAFRTPNTNTLQIANL